MKNDTAVAPLKITGISSSEKYTTNDPDFLPEELAPVVGRELEDMMDGGFPVTAARIVLRAKDPSNPMHKFFEWNDTVAAVAHRKNQARKLVQSLAVVSIRNDRQLKSPSQFTVSVVDPKQSGAILRPPPHLSVSAARRDPLTRKEVARQAYCEVRAWAAKYEAFGLDEFEPIFEAVSLCGK